jgi:SAM-dependent methyltransferase
MNDSKYLDWKDWRDGSFGGCEPLLAAYFAAETGIRARPGVRVLEVGFGNGAFIGWARSMGIEIFGIELSDVLVERATRLLGENRAFPAPDDPELTKHAGTFSHIVAFDVVEHIRLGDLPHFLRQMRDLLAPDGRLLLRFPNGDSPFGRINQHGDPTHVTTLGQERVRYLADEAGLVLESIRAPRLALTGTNLKRRVRRSLLRAGRYIVERAVGYLYFGGRVLPLDPNYVALLARTDDPKEPAH